MHGSGFDAAVAPDGYAWWYIDALSDDGQHGLTLIAFIGSVFSPYYAWARRRGPADPLAHCALNVALYGPGHSRWAMTERGGRQVQRDASHLCIGPSSLTWEGDTLVVRIDEITAPWPSRIRGSLRLHPAARLERAWPLDDAGRHHWQPIAPCARVEVDLQAPGLRWSGAGYMDANRGGAPLAHAFTGWDWSRASHRGDTFVLYDIRPRSGEVHCLALRFDAAGTLEPVEAPDLFALPRSAWGLRRATRADPGHAVRIVRELENGPFYARAVLASSLRGVPLVAIHESLSLERFSAPWVQMLLPFRMPRRRG